MLQTTYHNHGWGVLPTKAYWWTDSCERKEDGKGMQVAQS